MVCAFHQGGLFGGARIAAAPLDELHDMHKKKKKTSPKTRGLADGGRFQPGGGFTPWAAPGQALR